MIKAVIFDCYGVLFGDAYTALRGEFPEVGEEMRDLSRRANLGEISGEERRAGVVALLDGIGVDGERVVGEMIGGMRKDGVLLERIWELRKKYKTGLLSNTGAGFWERFSKEEVEGLFDDVVLSYEVGMVKPDAEIYRLAAERLGVRPEECVFVDDQERNVLGARRVGMHGIVYEGVGEFLREFGEVAG